MQFGIKIALCSPDDVGKHSSPENVELDGPLSKLVWMSMAEAYPIERNGLKKECI